MTPLNMSAAPIGERLRPTEAYVTIVLPIDDVKRAITAADRYARELIDATVVVTAPDGQVLHSASVTVDGGQPQPSVCTVLVPFGSEQ